MIGEDIRIAGRCPVCHELAFINKWGDRKIPPKCDCGEGIEPLPFWNLSEKQKQEFDEKFNGRKAVKGNEPDDPMDLAVNLNETKPIRLPEIIEQIFRKHLGIEFKKGDDDK